MNVCPERVRDCWNQKSLLDFWIPDENFLQKFSLCFYPASVRGVARNGGKPAPAKRGNAHCFWRYLNALYFTCKRSFSHFE